MTKKKSRRFAENAENSEEASKASNNLKTKAKTKVFVSEVPSAFRFLCAMTHPNVDQKPEKEQAKVYRICELFQSSVQAVDMIMSKEGTVIKIVALNLEDPESENLLWTQIRNLIAHDTAYIEIHNLDEKSNKIATERYLVGDLVMSLNRNVSLVQPQQINITGKVIKEYVIE
jgi:hypothetical protein